MSNIGNLFVLQRTTV